VRLVEALLALALSLGSSACGTSGMPGSIGVIAVREATGRIVITEVPEGGAGAQAGLEKGDEILAIDGVAVAGMTVNDFHHAVRGAVGTHVVVDVRRDGMVHRVDVTRAVMRETKVEQPK
jgi:carboxyl-terminal processing protease